MLSVIGLIIMIVFAYYTYRSANENGRSALGWMFACLGSGVVLQLVIPMIIGAAIGFYMVSTGTPIDQIQNSILGWAVLIGVVCLALSIGAMLLILKLASRPVDDAEKVADVPPPPTFDTAE